LIGFQLSQFKQLQRITNLGLKLTEFFYDTPEFSSLFLDLCCTLRIIPESCAFDFFVDDLYSLLFPSDVKEAPLANPPCIAGLPIAL
jgi:hypothetical protein